MYSEVAALIAKVGKAINTAYTFLFSISVHPQHDTREFIVKTAFEYHVGTVIHVALKFWICLHIAADLGQPCRVLSWIVYQAVP